MAPILAYLLLPLAVSGLAVPWAKKGGKRFELQKSKCEAWQGASPDVASENYLTLSRADNLTSRSSTFFDNVRRVNNPGLYAKRDRLIKRQVGQLSTALGGAEYIVDIRFGDADVKAILDTGSSDTWLVQDGFQCTDAQGNPVDQSQCKFGPTYGGGFAEQIPDENFMVGYGNGEFVTGNMGFQDVTIGGITVPRAKVALASRTYWIGDNVATGLVGLAYGLITSAYKGTDSTQNSPSTRVPYDPLFTTMWKQGLSAPMFSLALQRGSGGYIAFGGLPPVQTSSDFASTALQEFKGLAGSAFTGQSFYTITPDALIFPGAATRQTSQFIIDSGTTLNHLPTNTARAINSLFSPKAVQTDGVWTVACNARAPQFGVRIGGQPFYINPVDMIFRDEATGVCVSAIQDGGAAPGPFVLGDQFLNSVVAVFDVGAAQMRFAVHNY